MKKPLFLLLFVCATVVSCKQTTEKQILGKWRSVKVENKDKDDFFRNSKAYIDTMGMGNSDSVNLEIYEVTNMDSLRSELKIQFDSAYAAQMEIETKSYFVFKSDSTIIFEYPGKSETGKWYIDEEGNLVLDETNELGETEQLKVGVTMLERDKMKLTFIHKNEEGDSDTSVVTFNRDKK